MKSVKKIFFLKKNKTINKYPAAANTVWIHWRSSNKSPFVSTTVWYTCTLMPYKMKQTRIYWEDHTSSKDQIWEGDQTAGSLISAKDRRACWTKIEIHEYFKKIYCYEIEIHEYFKQFIAIKLKIMNILKQSIAMKLKFMNILKRSIIAIKLKFMRRGSDSRESDLSKGSESMLD